MSDLAGSFTCSKFGWIFRSAAGYTIVRGKGSPMEWTAYPPGGRTEKLAAGVGDQGWLKCVEACREHYRLAQTEPASVQAPSSQDGLDL